jgi:hypothetical protein
MAAAYPWHVVVSRFLLGAVLLATGLGKLLDLRGFAGVIETYHVLPEVLAWPAGIVLTLSELALAAWLLRGRRLAPAGLVAAAMHLAYFGWSAVALLRGLDIANCGCFGIFLARPLTPWTLVEDGVLFLVAVILFVGAWRAEHPRSPVPSSIRGKR